MICSSIRTAPTVDIQGTMIKALVFAAALNVCVGDPNANETEAVKSLSEIKSLQIAGDFITIASKNSTEFNSTDSDDIFDEYLHTHVIRIKVLPNKYWNFELSDLIWDDEPEGRKKRTRLRDLLLPLLLALKYKLTVVLPIFMAFVTALALKGFWAGMTGLLVSKLVALKVLLRSQNKRDDDRDEDREDYHEQNDHNSDAPASYEIPYENADEEEHEDDSPILVRLHSDRRSGKFSRRRKGLPGVGRPFKPKRWNPRG